jgi:hypothetical protein
VERFDLLGYGLGRRADLLHLRSIECYVTDDIDEAIEAGQEELRLRRALGQRQEEGEALSWLAYILWCPGRTTESQRARRKQLRLETPRRVVARLMDSWPRRRHALDLAMESSATWDAIRALDSGKQMVHEGDGDDRAVHRPTGGPSSPLDGSFPRAGAAIRTRQYEVKNMLRQAVDYRSERGLELYRFYALGYRARRLDRGCGTRRPRRLPGPPHPPS